MSDKTRENVVNAIKEHFSDEATGGFMTDFALVITGVSSDSATANVYVYETSNSPYHAMLGLTHMLLNKIDEEGFSYDGSDE